MIQEGNYHCTVKTVAPGQQVIVIRDEVNYADTAIPVLVTYHLTHDAMHSAPEILKWMYECAANEVGKRLADAFMGIKQ